MKLSTYLLAYPIPSAKKVDIWEDFKFEQMIFERPWIWCNVS